LRALRISTNYYISEKEILLPDDEEIYRRVFCKVLKMPMGKG